MTELEIEKIKTALEQGKTLPEELKSLLISHLESLKHSIVFNTKKEYELVYADKEREVDILSDTMAVPLQKVKTFRNGAIPSPRVGEGKSEGDLWTNMLIFGDNLQVLKTLLQMKQEGKLKNADGTPGVRLVYIDPPFATRQEFRGSQDQKAYQDKIAGAKFLEFLRKRLVFLRELLSEDGSIYVHLDWKKGHYVKILMDEIFGENNFQNELIWQKIKSVKAQTLGYGNVTDYVLFYRKSDGVLFKQIRIPHKENYLNQMYRYVDQNGRRYRLHDFTQSGSGPARKFGVRGYIEPPVGKHWIWSQEKIDEGIERGLIVFSKSGTPQIKRYLDEVEGEALNDLWNDVNPIGSVSGERIGYPTQKPEALLERIIKASSNPGDLVLDCFAGSGTTLAVAEKLGRHWIGVDCGKLAIYTMQKRLLNIGNSKDLENPKKKYGKPCKPFTLYNAGLYDYKMIKELPWEQYRDFALKLFQCRDERHEISSIELDGYLGADSVMVFNYQKYPDAMMDRGFIDDLHKYLGDKIGRRFFIIAPAASVQFLEDYIQKGRTKYYILRIPYSIIEEIHNRGFTKIKQPVSEMDVNDTVDAVGFDFIQTPTVECRYFLDKPKKSDLFNQKVKECAIKIERFESRVISRKPLEFANLETLSMVMLEYDFNGEFFDLDEVFYAEDLKKNGYEVRFAKDKVKGQIMIIYIDIFGNEKRETKTLKDFTKA